MNKENIIPRCVFVFISGCLILFSCNENGKASKSNSVLLNDSLHKPDSSNAYSEADQSPMDMSYFPPDYSIQKMKGADTSKEPVARIIYSRPQKKGRILFGNTTQSLRQYGQEWRLGANEATEIEFFKDVVIAGKPIKKGRYIIYCIPYADKWVIVLNTNLYSWGLHLDASKDIFKTDIPTGLQSPPLEYFTMVFRPEPHGMELVMAWDNVKVVLPIAFAK